MNICSVILARGGSKGIPSKNMVCFYGKPLLYYAVMNSLKSKTINTVYVSSDSQEIREYARKLGADVIRRPSNLCQDTSSSESGWLHALTKITCDIIVAPQVTSPLCTTQDLDKALQLFIKENYDSLFSASPADDCFIWRGTHSLTYDYQNRQRRQDCIGNIIENGAFYIFKTAVLLNYNNRLGGKIGYYLMERWQKYEIDELLDLKICETIYRDKYVGMD